MKGFRQVPPGAFAEIAAELGATKSLVHYHARKMNVYTSSKGDIARRAVRRRWRNPNTVIPYGHKDIVKLARENDMSVDMIRRAILYWRYKRS